jgi:predicted lipid-binding transport protein (Tim44 family)
MAVLQNEWQDYLPRYFRTRWQANALYNLDLTPYEELLKTEKYAEAARQLAEILPFLEGSGQVDHLRQAVRLVERARRGNEAEKLVAEAQSAFGAGDYARAAELVAAAERSYVAIGNYSRADELHAFRDQMQKILALHGELDSLQSRLAVGSAGLWMSPRLVELDQRLGRLGDAPGQLRARQLASQVEAGQLQFQALAGALVAALVLGLLGLRIWLLRRPPAPEAQL